jgi:hypothetical protein
MEETRAVSKVLYIWMSQNIDKHILLIINNYPQRDIVSASKMLMKGYLCVFLTEQLIVNMFP